MFPIQDGNKGEMQSAFWPLAEAVFVYQLMFLSSWLVFAGSVDLLFKRISLQLTLSFNTLMLNLPTGVFFIYLLKAVSFLEEHVCFSSLFIINKPQ